MNTPNPPSLISATWRRGNRWICMILCVGLLLTLLAKPDPAHAFRLYGVERGDQFVGFTRDPLNIDVCYDTAIEPIFVDVLRKSLIAWNEATPYVRMRSMQPVPAPTYTADCDINVYNSIPYFDTDGDGVITGDETEKRGQGGRSSYPSRDGSIFTGNGYVILNSGSPYMQGTRPMDLDNYQSTIVHELGHVLGLEHPVSPGTPDENASIMADLISGLTVPQNDDIAGLADIYQRIPVRMPSPVDAPTNAIRSNIIETYPGDREVGLPSETSPSVVALGEADGYEALAHGAIQGTSSSSVTGGDLGVPTGGTIAGFTADNLYDGSQRIGDHLVGEAHADLAAAITDAASRTAQQTGLQNLENYTYLPGIYAGENLTLAGTMILSGDPSSVFIFTTAGTLSVAANSHVTITGGANECNIFWQVGGSASIGNDADFTGTVLSDSSIAVSPGTQVKGRLLSINGDVDLNGATLTRSPQCETRTPSEPPLEESASPIDPTLPVAPTTPVETPDITHTPSESTEQPNPSTGAGNTGERGTTGSLFSGSETSDISRQPSATPRSSGTGSPLPEITTRTPSSEPSAPGPRPESHDKTAQKQSPDNQPGWTVVQSVALSILALLIIGAILALIARRRKHNQQG